LKPIPMFRIGIYELVEKTINRGNEKYVQ
jgi:hypothetical protein